MIIFIVSCSSCSYSAARTSQENARNLAVQHQEKYIKLGEAYGAKISELPLVTIVRMHQYDETPEKRKAERT